MLLKIGAIYSLRYQRWQTNYKIYAFILWPGGGATKTHLLNIGAIQLNVIDRARIVRTIVRLSRIPQATKYNGRLLYKILKRYLPNQIRKCYRTFFTNFITHAALINFGLNNPEDFSEMELGGQSKELYLQAQRDYQVKAINWHSKRGYDMKKAETSMAGAEKVEGSKVDQTTAGGPVINKPAVKSAIKEAPKDDGDEFGY